MKTGRLSVSYSRALLLFAQERKEDALVYDQMNSLVRQFKDVAGLKACIERSLISEDKRLDLLVKACGIRDIDTDGYCVNRFLKMLFEKKRDHMILSIALQYGEQYRHCYNIHHALLVTAIPAAPSVCEKFKSILAEMLHGTIELSTEVNDKLMGGYNLSVDQMVIDASVATQLAAVRKNLSENLYKKK